MTDTNKIGTKLGELGYEFYSGVPCSSLKYLINYAINECEYVMAANEGDAVAIASGACLGGKKAVVLFQNSGLTNAVSPLTSLNFCFRIPILGFVSLRGEPGIKDEPQHELMGQITADMLKTMRIDHDYLSNDTDKALKQLEKAGDYLDEGKSFFFIVRKGTFTDVELKDVPASKKAETYHGKENRIPGHDKPIPSRYQVLDIINHCSDDQTAILATTGKTGRELYEINDRPGNLYMVGSMGCISSLGLGLAMVKPAKRVIAVDGDGALIMRMGSLATNAFYRPCNLLHILIDNNSYDSTGGQLTVSHTMNFTGVAEASGYPVSLYAHDLEEFEGYIKAFYKKPILTFLYIKVAKGSKKNLGRPTIKPHEVKERLVTFLKK